MTQDQYLAQTDVGQFKNWLSGCLDGEGTFCHNYRVRRGGYDWKCRSLYDAFLQYSWNKKSFHENRVELEALQLALRTAMASRDVNTVAAACIGILEWGGVSSGNRFKVLAYGSEIVSVLEHDEMLLSEVSPTASRFRELKEFNSGWTKIYSLLIDNLIIYDSRVGAAMGLLVRNWCLSSGHNSIPHSLAFRWASARVTKEPKNRNPSKDALRFPTFSNQKAPHALCAIHASWLLDAAIKQAPSRFSESANPLRALEAALFMVGYDLGNLD